MDLNLRDKGSIVESLWHTVDDAAGNLKHVPALVRKVIETEAWRRREQRGKVYEHSSFLSFITEKPVAGCGWPTAKVEALLKDHPDELRMWREATTGKPGRPETNNNVMNKPGRQAMRWPTSSIGSSASGLICMIRLSQKNYPLTPPRSPPAFAKNRRRSIKS